MELTSELYSLEKLVDQTRPWRFNVPIYQRLYVWGDDQVRTLLNDVIDAYQRNEPIFYLGGVLMVEQTDAHAHTPNAPRVFDLIDGQQRFTTLWMLCHAWRRALEPFLTVHDGDANEPRLQFAIRPEANAMLNAWAKGESIKIDADGAESGRRETGLDRMGRAVRSMQQVFSARAQNAANEACAIDWNGLTRFVYEKVKFVVTQMPREADLNKLFEVVNNRGVQLQHHEVLKARMLDRLKEEDRASFAVLWDACADTDDYCERNLAALSGLHAYEVQALYARKELGDASVVRSEVQRGLESSMGGASLHLADILAEYGAAVDKPSKQDPAFVAARVRSIVGFPLLLQHALRIWLHRNGEKDLPRVLDRQLLALFEAHFLDVTEGAEPVEKFIDLLWEVRVLFDFNVIKWVDQGSEEVHLISAVSKSSIKGRDYINRSRDTDSNRDFALLQSMLYHSQEITTQYWLTPLLSYMLERKAASADEYFHFLQHLDNHLLGSASDGSLAERTRSFMEEPWQQRPLIHGSALIEAEGVDFAHYWFYKLEFILWHQKIRKTDAWQRFRITAKNSVEHVSPQTPRGEDRDLVDQMLDRFGNLALVSGSVNSENSNRPFNEKRLRFHNRNNEKVDSLKLALLFENKTWSDKLAEDHERDMIKCFDDYVASCSKNAQKYLKADA